MNARIVFMGIIVALLAGLNVYQYREAGLADSETSEDMLAESGVLVLPESGEQESPELSNQELAARFHRLFIDEKPLFKSKWLGVPVLQFPFDMWVTQEIIFETKPDVIVETGTFLGGSALLWATILAQVNPEGRIITVDVRENPKEASKHPLWKQHIEFIQGSSVDPEVAAEVKRRIRPGDKVMVILDSLHVKTHVLPELELFAPLVTPGNYLVVQDTHLGDTVPFWMKNLEKQWEPGPKAAVDEYIASHPEFEVDSSRERFLVTNNHGGFVKRVK